MPKPKTTQSLHWILLDLINCTGWPDICPLTPAECTKINVIYVASVTSRYGVQHYTRLTGVYLRRGGKDINLTSETTRKLQHWATTSDVEIMVYLGILDTRKFLSSQKIVTKITAILSQKWLWCKNYRYYCREYGLFGWLSLFCFVSQKIVAVRFWK